MTSRSLRVGALLGSVSMLAFAGAAAAADASSGGIEEVVVTAEKRSEEAKNVPISITVLGQDELSKLNIRNFEDIMAQVPGLSVSQDNPTHPVLILRGINAGGDGSTVGTYLDETPYGSSNALANGVDTAPNLDTFDMQRVEVLRGPQGTLYGAGAEGGLLKFVTNAPNMAGFEGAVEATGTDMDHGGTGGSIRGMVNVALTDDLAVRVVGFDVSTPGYINDPALGLHHVNDVKSYGGRASVLWTPTSKISVRANVLEQQLDSGGSAEEDVTLVGGRIVPLFGEYEQKRTVPTPASVRYYLYNTTIDWDLDFATLTSSSSYTDLHDFTFNDDTGVLGANVQGFLKQGKFIQEVRLASNPGQGPLDWLIGVYYANEHDDLHQDVVFTLHGASLESLNLDSAYLEKTAFANATYHVTSNFELGAGIRYATDSQGSTENLTVPIVATLAGGTSSHSEVTWSVDARYHFDDQTMAYARVATGWRPGGPNDLPPVVPPGTPKSFAPDSLTDYELGVKSDLPLANLSFDAAVYDIQWRDIQLLELVNGFNINGNGGKAESKGIEGDITWTPIERLVLNLNGAYTNAKLTEDAPAVGGFSGDPLPFSPKSSVTLNGDYTFSPMGDFTPYVGASWRYVGSRGWGFGTTPLEGRLPSYDTFDLRAGIDWQRWSIEIYGTNLSNAKGITDFGPGGSIASGNALAAAIIQPRIVGLALRGKF